MTGWYERGTPRDVAVEGQALATWKRAASGDWRWCCSLLCCFLLCVAGNVPAEYVRQLWDLLLKDTWDAAGSATNGADDGSSRLEQCCEQVEALGVKFYPMRAGETVLLA